MASGKSLSIQLQKIASNAQVEVQRLANEATQKSFDYNAREAATNRDWEKMMSDTSHQREVADLKKAGLNPVLAANNGAQSYVSSSASADAKDASSAVANLAAQRMGSEAQGYAADRSAAATRYAAKTTAAATRAAAAAQASAARYAAAMQYENNRQHEAWQTAYMKEKYAEHTKMLNSTPPKNVAGLIYQFTNRAGMQDALINSNVTKGLTNFVKTALNNPGKFFKDNVSVTKGNFNKFITGNGVKAINTQLKQLGIRPTKGARSSFIKAFFFNDKSAMNRFIVYLPKKSNSAVLHRYSGFTIR